MARIFQDSAGTTPVTTFDQPVGKIVRGAGTVDLVQSDPGKRPTMKLFEPVSAAPRWYLYCPAGTGLEAVVDAGEYEVASLDPWGGVAYETVTSDGSTPIAFTRSTMIMDILFRTPIFSEGEKVAIEQYWSKWKIEPEVDDLYMAGQRGVFLDFSDQSTLFQTDDTSTPVTDVNDPIGLALDLSGNGVNMVQTVQAARGQYKTDGDAYRVQLDKVDDNYEFDFTGSGGFEATWYQPSKEGLVKGKLLIPDGVWKLARERPNSFPSNNIMGLIIVEGDVPEAMDRAIFDWWEAKGCGIDFGLPISMREWFRERLDILGLDNTHWDCHQVTSFRRFGSGETGSNKLLDWILWPNLVCNTPGVDMYALLTSTRLTELDTSGWEISPGSMSAAFFRVPLKHFDFSGFDGSYANIGGAYSAFDGVPLETCVVGDKFFQNLDSDVSFPNSEFDTATVDEILVAVEASGSSGRTFTMGANNAAPSAIGEAAIDALRLRNWTVTVTGGY